MAFKAMLDINGKERDILSCDYKLERDVDLKGRASSRVYGGQFTVEIESTADVSLIEQMLNHQYLPFDGKIKFFKGDENDAELKTLEFKKAYMVKFHENLDIRGKRPMTITMTISAEQLIMGAAEYNGEWPTP